MSSIQTHADAMFEFIAHGDEKHREWLRAACVAFCEGKPRPPVDTQSEPSPEAFVRDLLWNTHPECCGCPVVGAEYMGSTEWVCCGQPSRDTLNDAQIVASLRERFPDPSAAQAEGEAQ